MDYYVSAQEANKTTIETDQVEQRLRSGRICLFNWSVAWWATCKRDNVRRKWVRAWYRSCSAWSAVPASAESQSLYRSDRCTQKCEEHKYFQKQINPSNPQVQMDWNIFICTMVSTTRIQYLLCCLHVLRHFQPQKGTWMEDRVSNWTLPKWLQSCWRVLVCASVSR